MITYTNCVVIWKPKIPSEFAKRAARYNEFRCKQRNPRNLRPKTWGDMSYNSFKAGRSSKDTMAQIWNLERHLGKHCSNEVQPENSCESAFANFDMFTRAGRGSGRKRCLQAPPFSLPAVFRSLSFSLLPCFFRFSFPFFAYLHWPRAWYCLL